MQTKGSLHLLLMPYELKNSCKAVLSKATDKKGQNSGSSVYKQTFEFVLLVIKFKQVLDIDTLAVPD